MTDRTIVKRVSLDGILDFDAECFALVKPATVNDKIEFRRAIETIKDGASAGGQLEADFQQKMVDSHFVSGRIKALDEHGVIELVDMSIEDVQLAEVSDYLYIQMLGLDLDPKGIAAEAAENLKLSADEKPIETPSSTVSPTSTETSPKS